MSKKREYSLVKKSFHKTSQDSVQSCAKLSTPSHKLLINWPTKYKHLYNATIFPGVAGSANSNQGQIMHQELHFRLYRPQKHDAKMNKYGLLEGLPFYKGHAQYS